MSKALFTDISIIKSIIGCSTKDNNLVYIHHHLFTLKISNNYIMFNSLLDPFASLDSLLIPLYTVLTGLISI